MILDNCKEKTHESLVGRIYENAVMPVVVAADADEALLVANAINNAGIKCIEITYRTSAATEAIKLIKKEIPDVCRRRNDSPHCTAERSCECRCRVYYYAGI